MEKYDLSTMISKKRLIVFDSIEARLSSYFRYRSLILLMNRMMILETRRAIIPVYLLNKSLVSDSLDWFSSLKSKMDLFLYSIASKIESIFKSEEKSHTNRFVRSVMKAVGIDVSIIVKSSDQKRLIDIYIEKNVSLISSMGSDMLKRIEQTIYDAKIKKIGSVALSKLLQSHFDIMKTRADLIAFDQLRKLNADFNEARQRQAGIKRYSWSGVLDERERGRHLALEGKIYKWGDRTGAENGLPPGKAILCRCIARPVI